MITDVYRARWSVVLAEALPVPLAALVVAVVVLRPVGVGIVVEAVLAVAMGAALGFRVRRRTLRISDTGIEVQRDRYAMRASWDDITGVRRRRIRGLIAVDELLLADAELVPRTSRGAAGPLPSALATHPAAKRIQISIYDEDWRSGPVGEQLRRRGLL